VISLSATVQLPWGVRFAPIYLYRSALPVNLIDGRDLNLDGDAVDIPAKAYAVDSFDANAAIGSQTTFKETGNCETVNCGRGMGQQQMNVRFSKVFNLGGRAHVEAIGEVFNLFNAKNPFINVTTRRLSSTGAPLSSFMQPAAYAGDFGQPEQRVGQVGFRLTF